MATVEKGVSPVSASTISVPAAGIERLYPRVYNREAEKNHAESGIAGIEGRWE
jgi:hypothetical protein